MTRDTWTWAELFAGLDPTPAFVEELERLGLLRVVARDKRGEHIYDADARDTLERVMVLVEAGYEPRDIAVIAHKVGLKEPKRRLGRRAPTLLRFDDVARAIGVEPAKVEAWHASGWVTAQLLTEGGVPMFSQRAVEQARALADLTTLGLDVDVVTWAGLAARLARYEAGADGEGADALVREASDFARQVLAASDRLRLAARRWAKRLAAFDKRVERVRRLHAPEVARVKPRRRVRTHVQTRSTSRKP